MIRTLLLSLVFFACQLHGADPAATDAGSIVLKEPAPEWVRPIAVDTTLKTPKEGTGSGVYYLCSDAQMHIEKREDYGHYAYRFLNTSGLENKSQLSINFDPVYQTMRLHRLIIHRDGKKLDRLAETDVRVIEQESGHEQQLYDGSKTALFILKDIRVGDVLEYAYTLKGSNPVFGNHYCAFQNLGFNVTVANIHKRFIWDPKVRTLRHKIFNSDHKVSINKDNALHEMTFEAAHSPPKKRDDDTPGWLLTSPLLQVTDYASWDEFADWARPLYKIGTDLPEPLRNECERIRKLPTDSARVMAALQFVQSNIRYLGSFMGTHSHEPYPVETIYARRFGDCKDKSIILCTMLKYLGYDAAPALVDTDDKKTITQFLPGHFNFDHVIVRLKLDNEIYWLDGTRTFQCGSLDNLYTPDYGYTFVINETSNSLSPLKPRGFDVKKTVISERFVAPDLSGKVTLDVTTTATGSDADYMRDYFSTTNIKEITENYQKFYSGNHPEITAEPVTFTDDRERNQFVVHEKYEITAFWKEDDSNKKMMQGWLHAKSVYNKIDKPSSPLRTMPYAIYHPVNTHHTLSIELPTDWNFSDVTRNIDREAFRFTASSETTPRSIKLKYHYQSKQGHVPISSLKKYIDDCENAENDTYYQLSFDKSLIKGGADAEQGEEEVTSDGKTGTLSIILILSIVCAVGLGALIALIAFFYDPAPRPTVQPEHLHGLSGWLVLVAIRLCLDPIILLGVFSETGEFFQGDSLNVLLDSGYGGNVIAVFVALSTTAFLIPLSILLIVLFFKKRSSFPAIFIIITLLSLVISAVSYVLLTQSEGVGQADIDETLGSLIIFVIHTALWVPYMCMSKRVRNTFRMTRKTLPAPTSTPPCPPTLPSQSTPKPNPASSLGSPPPLPPPLGG